MFDSTKEDLQTLLERASSAKLQLPDFQRDWVWDDDAIKGLIASIVRGFPVGAVLTLSTGGDLRFKPRALATIDAGEVEPEELLLDGQQRLTSLYQALFSSLPVKTRTAKGQSIERYYFLDIRRGLNAASSHEDMIIGMPADKIERTNFGRDIVLDLSTPEKQYEEHMFPLNRSYDERDWYYGWKDYWRQRDVDIHDIERGFGRSLLHAIQRYEMPIIRLSKDSSREAICLVFEKVNTGGKRLDAFELLTAVYAADEYDLRDDWLGTANPPGRRARLLGEKERQDVFKELKSTDFLQTCTLLHGMDRREAAAAEGKTGRDLPAVTINRDALLNLPLDAYKRHTDSVEAAFVEAGQFLNARSIFWHKDVPYPPQLIGLAGVFARMGRDARSAAAQEKLDEWFWCGVLGERYGGATDSRLARDVPELVAWIGEDGPKPTTVQEAIFQLDRLDTLRTRLSAAYKGLHALLMREGCQDFISGKPVDIMTFFQARMDIHHIFPSKWCEDQGIEPKVFNSILNKTAISAESNRRIGGNAPSAYLKKIEDTDKLSSDQLDTILRTHLIDPDLLRADDFDGFMAARRSAFSAIIESAMRKRPIGESGTDEPTGEPEDIDENDIDDAA